MANKRILVVEDESITAMEIEDRLKDLGYTVSGIVGSGEEAIIKAEETRPDLVMMDIHLKGEMDGIEAAEHIRKNFGIPVIYLTAYSDDQTLERAKITEPFAYIIKPFEERELHSNIEISFYKSQMERTLRESEERYRSFVQNFLGIAYRADMDFAPVFFHGAVEEITGYSEEELVAGNPPWDGMIHPDDLFKLLEEGEIDEICSLPNFSCEREYRIIRKDGEIRWVHEIMRNVRLDSDRPTFVEGSIYDITPRKGAERELKRLYRESEEIKKELQMAYDELRKIPKNLILSEKIAGMGTLASGIAHEMNDPLKIITSQMKIILENDDITEIKENVVELSRAIDGIKKISHDLSIYSRDARIVEHRPIDLNEEIEESIDILKYYPKFIDVHLTVELDKVPKITANKEEIQQVIINFFINALDAMEGKGDLSIKSEERDDFIWVEITYTDEGLLKKEPENIFDVFFTGKRVGEGTGLGLYIAHRIINKYGGTVGIEKVEGKENRFTMTFPITARTQK